MALEDAAEAVGTRDGTHGSPADNFDLIADLWESYLGFPIEPYQVAEMMVLLKVARSASGSPDHDHHVDIAGYAEIADMLAEDPDDD